MLTRENFVTRTREIVLAFVADPDTGELPPELAPVRAAKLCYGVGQSGVRGVTIYGAWQSSCGSPVDLIEIAAIGEESPVQLAGTTIHELAHALAGYDAGHGKDWKTACHTLGLRCAKAAGHRYNLASFDPSIRSKLAKLFELADGSPNFGTRVGAGPFGMVAPRPCGAGIGTRGGKSRGKGSGSRMRLYECACAPKPMKIRCASDTLDATCNVCTAKFERK